MQGEPPHWNLFIYTLQGKEPYYIIAASCHCYVWYRFIPGTSANDFHYQAYLLEGLVRWNKARSLAATQQGDGSHTVRTFNMRLADKVGRPVVLDSDGPYQFKGECIDTRDIQS